MKKILITYGTNEFTLTLKRLKREAKSLSIFDEIIVYSPSDLPDFIINSPLMGYSKGGGYWIWKPYIIWKTLVDNPEAIVIYVDAGCKLNHSEIWSDYFNKINDYNNILFSYRLHFPYNWHGYKFISTRIKYWTKKETVDYFDKRLDFESWKEMNKVWGGFIISKSCNNLLIDEWLRISLFKPELIIDPLAIEKQSSIFSQHRHDQSILTPIGYYYSSLNTKEVLILPEISESQPDTSPVGASRVFLVRKSFRKHFVNFIKSFMGDSLFQKLHFWN